MRRIRPIESVFLLFIFLYPIFPSYLGARVGGVLLNAPRVMTILVIVLLIVEAAVNRRSVPRLMRVARRSHVTVAFVVGYLIVRFASAFSSDDLETSLNAAMSDDLCIVVFLYLGVYLAKDLRRLDAVMTALVMGAALLCVLGIIESVIKRNVITSAFPMLEVTDDDYLQFALSEKMRGTYRVQTTFVHPLAFASYLVLMTPLAIYGMQRAKTAAAKWFYFSVVALIAVNAFLTGSRAALLLTSAIALVYWCNHILGLLKARPYVKRAIGVTHLGFFSLLVILAIPVAQQLVAGESKDEQSSSAGRLVQLEKGARTVAEHPLLGVGPRMAGKYAGLYQGQREATVDNWYLTVVVESGIVALPCFVASLVAVVSRCRKLIALHRGNPRIANVFLALLIAVTAFSLFMLILSIHADTFPYLFLIMGAVLSMNDLASGRMRTIAYRGMQLHRSA